MALFFQQELATSIEVIDGDIVIIQYTDNEGQTEIGRVLLTRHQFDEMFDMQRILFSGEK